MNRRSSSNAASLHSGWARRRSSRSGRVSIRYSIWPQLWVTASPPICSGPATPDASSSLISPRATAPPSREYTSVPSLSARARIVSVIQAYMPCLARSAASAPPDVEMICRVQACTCSRSASGTPITSLTTAIGKGSRTRSIRSAGGPSATTPSTSVSSSACARGRSRFIAPTVKAPAIALRSRLWSGWSANASDPGRGLKCGAMRVT